ncbi:MAG TPA: hypothetical protein VIK72_18430 [Clostridiaceae bacterium]
MDNKTELTLKKMDEIKDLDFSMDVDISQIILKAEIIKNKKKDMKEFILFLTSTSTIVLLVYCLIMLEGTQRFILYFEILFFTLAPFMIIPAALSSRVREE